MVTILVDATDITNLSGSRTAVYELYKAVFQIKSNWNFIVLVSKVEESFNRYPWVKQIYIPSKNRFVQRIFTQLIILKYDLWKKIDIVHFSRSIGGITVYAKNVISIFDITPLLYPSYYPKYTYMYWKFFFPYLLLFSDKIIAISQTVKSDLIKYYHLMDTKVDVVYCAPKQIVLSKFSMNDINRVRSKYSLPDKYLLYVGIIAKKKNLPTLIDALYLIKIRGIEIPPLVIAGGLYPKSNDYTALVEIIKKRNMGNNVLLIGSVQDNELGPLIHGASIFLYPSLHEGFGIPCLEAMACGVPVITTNTGAIPEIVGDAAILVQDPLDPAHFADAILIALNDYTLRLALIKKGIKRSHNFSWTTSAKKLIEVFESVL
ncbi:MAG: glycosyltransferase family 4 protein [Bacteroidales bacterium]